MESDDIRVLSFDCYGTLIDWETGIADQLESWVRRHGIAIDREALLEMFARAEPAAETTTPGALYPDILRAVHRTLALDLGLEPEPTEADRFAVSVGDWPPFPDTGDALRRLAARYRLVILSNIDRVSFARTNEALGVSFDAVITAEEVGAYKPDRRMFDRLFEVVDDWRIDRGSMLHAAQSLHHDHVPAKALGLRTAWVNRRAGRDGGGATPVPDAEVQPDIEVRTLEALADALK